LSGVAHRLDKTRTPAASPGLLICRMSGSQKIRAEAIRRLAEALHKK
jgi:hypothetical protein